MTKMTTLNVCMMVITLIMKLISNTLKMMIDGVELMNEMMVAVKTSKSKSGMMKMLIVILMMKIIDSMISNTVSVCIDMMKIITKVVNATELTGIIEFIFIAITTMLNIDATATIAAEETAGVAMIIIVMIAGVSITAMVAAIAIVTLKIMLSYMTEMHLFNSGRDTVPLCQTPFN